jgi:hypothetical protein
MCKRKDNSGQVGADSNDRIELPVSELYGMVRTDAVGLNSSSCASALQS